MPKLLLQRHICGMGCLMFHVRLPTNAVLSTHDDQVVPWPVLAQGRVGGWVHPTPPRSISPPEVRPSPCVTAGSACARLCPVQVPILEPSLLGTPFGMLLNELRHAPKCLLDNMVLMLQCATGMDAGEVGSSTARAFLYVLRTAVCFENALALLVRISTNEHTVWPRGGCRHPKAGGAVRDPVLVEWVSAWVDGSDHGRSFPCCSLARVVVLGHFVRVNFSDKCSVIAAKGVHRAPAPPFRTYQTRPRGGRRGARTATGAREPPPGRANCHLGRETSSGREPPRGGYVEQCNTWVTEGRGLGAT